MQTTGKSTVLGTKQDIEKRKRLVINSINSKTISNEQLHVYTITEVEPWNITIKRRRLKY